MRDGRIVEDIARGDPPPPDQLAVPAQARAAHGADHRRHRPRHRGVRGHAHGERGCAHRPSAQTIDRIAGKTDLQITAGETGFGEDVLDKVQSAATVRVAVPVIEAVVESHSPAQGNLLVLGVDMTGDRSLRDYDLETGDEADRRRPSDVPGAARLDHRDRTSWRERNGCASATRLALQTADGEKAFTVRGIMQADRPGHGIRRQPGDHGRLCRPADVRARANVRPHGSSASTPGRRSPTHSASSRRSSVPASRFSRRSRRGQQAEAMLAGYTMMVNISSVFALFIGHVHHLQLLCDGGRATAVRDRHSACPGRDAPAGSDCSFLQESLGLGSRSASVIGRRGGRQYRARRGRGNRAP